MEGSEWRDAATHLLNPRDVLGDVLDADGILDGQAV